MITINIHATCIRLGKAGKAFGAPPTSGVLILGPSGAGKSDLALRLIERGADLVADDRTDLRIDRGALTASTPANIAGLLEIRGLGIIELPHRPKATISLVVELRPRIERMPVHGRYTPPAPLKLAANKLPPLIFVNPLEASAPAKVAAAAAAFASGLFRDTVKQVKRG
ncbi:MAG TPA: HPr kinase/phosphatase C-terminal domain-containing protein [Rhizomicrobium sp.]|jgi:serine kinase of HPr protein (carbohydrate metabolism regulator)|nr:HPr kinase/phosphatase C-terminal domain-containing protein [Rhizomicrobium sp.]